MKTIGFIDHYLDEWHAENYPRWIRESGLGSEFEVRMAWAETEAPGRRSNAEWCEAHGVELTGSLEELIGRSDCLVVLSPDNPERHEALALPALASGKPTCIDKPFAPDLAAARRIFAAADERKTPMFSSSALRFAAELNQAREKLAGGDLEFVATGGGDNFASYGVHQAEMLVALTGKAAQRVKYCGTPHAALVIAEFGDGLSGSMQVIREAPFRLSAVTKEDRAFHCPEIQPAFFPRFIQAMLEFFVTGEPPFPRWQTEAVVSLLDAAFEGVKQPDVWISAAAIAEGEV